MLILLFIPFLYKTCLRGQKEPLSNSDKHRLDSLTGAFTLEADSDVTGQTDTAYHPEQEADLNPHTQIFRFNPNTISENDMILLGFNKKLAQRIIKYRNKGGKFRKKEDLLKIYFFPKNLYKSLHDSITLPDSLPPRYSAYDTAHRKTFKPYIPPQPFDINTADSAQLVAVRGIGPYYAYQIITYRNKLGGFIKPEQLKEVWPLDSVDIAELLKYAQFRPNPDLYKLNINSASEAALMRHPYMPKRMAKLIPAYRLQHGPFQDIGQVLQIKHWKSEDFNRIEPYLTVGD